MTYKELIDEFNRLTKESIEDPLRTLREWN